MRFDVLTLFPEIFSGYLSQSILKKAFEGRLVPQDPNDEPASELLKRIEARGSYRISSTISALARGSAEPDERIPPHANGSAGSHSHSRCYLEKAGHRIARQILSEFVDAFRPDYADKSTRF